MAKIMRVQRILLTCLLVVVVALDAFLPSAHAFTTDMNASTVIGEPDFTTNSGGVTTRNGLYYPAGDAFDSLGHLWVADSGNNRVLEFVPPFTNGTDAALVLGQPDFTSNTPDNYPQTKNGFNEPAAVAFDSAGNLWVADSNGDRVLEFKPPFTTNMDAALVVGQTSFQNQCPCTTRYELSGPSGLAFDKSGDLWVADHINNRVLEFKPPFSMGMNANLVLGQGNFTTSTPQTTVNGLHSPQSLAFDSAGDLWVSEYDNNRVMMFKPPFSNGINAALVLGQANFNSGNSNQGSTIGQSGFNSPSGLGFDSSGNLWVSDTNNNRVLMFMPPFSSDMNAALVLGQPDFSNGLGSTSQNGFAGPEGLTFDSAGNLWVVDDSNHRVLEFLGPQGLTTSTLILQTGWNLVSLPVVPQNSMITQVLGGLIQYNDLSMVWSYSTAPKPAWSSFTPPGSGTLKTMVDGLGYWVDINTAVNMTINGYVIPPPPGAPPAYTLSTGWNLVGFKPQPNATAPETASTYLSSISGSYDTNSIWVYDSSTATWMRAAPTYMLQPGYGFWIYMTAPATLRP